MSDHKKYRSAVTVLAALLTLSVGFSIGVYFRSFEEAQGETVLQAEERSRSRSAAPFSFRDVAADVLPVVVEVDTVEVTEAANALQMLPFDFFGLKPDRKEKDKGEEKKKEKKREFRRPGLGSGVIVKQNGDQYYVLTNNHVVEKADEMKVVLNNGAEYKAELVGRDERVDLALISIDSGGDKLPVAVIGDSDSLEVGDWVLAVGSPFGYMSTVTAGIVSAKGRRGPDSNISDFIQTDAAINSGNSGGALVNLKGEVVGINTWIATKTGDSAGLGFSIPINNARKAIDDFIRDGEVEYGWLGVSISNLDETMKESLNIGDDEGAFVHNVYIGSPADKGGLQAGDYVIAIDGRAVTSSDELVRTVGNLKPGEKIEFELIRTGKKIRQIVTIGKRASQEKILSNSENLWPGIAVADINEEIRGYFEFEDSIQGLVIVSIEKGSLASGGLRPGDVIISINDNPVKNMSDFYANFKSGERRYMIEYERGGSSYYFGIKR